MELLLDTIESLIYIYEEVFWLKECFTTLKSILVFLLSWWIIKLDAKEELFLYLASIIGVVCIFFGDIGYLSDNDVLKLIAPTILFLIMYDKNRKHDLALFMFLIPYFATSYEFYRSHYYVIMSTLSHGAIIACIIVVKQNTYVTLFFSVVIGIVINFVGSNYPPGTNDILVNPALITLAVKGLEFYTKNGKYVEFLKAFWTTLMCFAYFGSWIFHYSKQMCPIYQNH